MKAIISLAARMRSTRLPGKIMAEVAGKPILQHLVERLRHAQAEVVIANNEDDPQIQRLAAHLDVVYIPGAGCDMMKMHWLTANSLDADYILLAGADDPFLDPALFDMVLDRLTKGDVAYVKTAGWPLGLNVWGWTRQAMEDGHQLATAPDERQHVVPFWERRPKTYPSAVLHRAGEDLYDRFRVTVDGPSDLELVRHVYAAIAIRDEDGNRRPIEFYNFSAEAVIDFLIEHPHIAALNADGLHGYAARDAIYDVTPVDERPDLAAFASWQRFRGMADAAMIREVRAHVGIEYRAALAADREEPREFHQGRAAALLSVEQWLHYKAKYG